MIMATDLESITTMETMGDYWDTQSQYSNGVADINMVTQNDPWMYFGSTGGNVMNFESNRIDSYLAPYSLPHLNSVSNASLELNGTMMLGDNYLCTGLLPPYLCPPKNINMPTKYIQPQHKIQKIKRQTTKNPTKRKAVVHKEEENNFIQSLRAQNIPWKEISRLFFQKFGRELSNASLQMRMLRRRKRAGVWPDSDIKMLQEANDYWERKKFALIATKLQELGASQPYTERQVRLQLEHVQYEWAKESDE